MNLMNLVNTANQITGVYNQYKTVGHSFNDVFDMFSSSSVSEMFDKSGLSMEAIRRRLDQDILNIDRLKHSDTFFFEIHRVAPYYDREKSSVISSMVKQVDYVSDGIELEEKKIGSAYINARNGTQSGEMSVTFHEFEDGDVLDFLTKISPQNTLTGLASDLGLQSTFNALGQKIGKAKNLIGNVNKAFSLTNAIVGTNLSMPLGLSQALGGVGDFVNQFTENNHKNIMPTDGTYLLPYDYYFQIKLSHIVRDRNTGMSYEKIIVNDEYLLDGNISFSYTTGEEAYLEANATFKPLKNFR